MEPHRLDLGGDVVAEVGVVDDGDAQVERVAERPEAPVFSYFTHDGGFSVIDGFIVKPAPGRFVLVLKDERELPKPTKHLRVAEATRADGPDGPASAPISIDWVEGPSVLRRGDRWIVYYDEYTRKKYGAIESADLKTWRLVDGEEFPAGTRHGTAFQVNADVVARLSKAF